MGSNLVPAVAVQEAVHLLVTAGNIVDPSMAGSYYFKRGELQASGSASNCPEIKNAIESFGLSAQLAENETKDEARLYCETLKWISGCPLLRKMQSLQTVQRAAQEGATAAAKINSTINPLDHDLKKWSDKVLESCFSAFSRVPGTLPHWKNLEVGTKVIVIDNLTELERACDLPAPNVPGASAVRFTSEMRKSAGATLEVRRSSSSNGSYRLSDGYNWPYNVLRLAPSGQGGPSNSSGSSSSSSSSSSSGDASFYFDPFFGLESE